MKAEKQCRVQNMFAISEHDGNENHGSQLGTTILKIELITVKNTQAKYSLFSIESRTKI